MCKLSRVIAAGDSLGLPRLKPAEVSWSQVWPTLLEDHLRERGLDIRVENHCRRERTLPRFLKEYDDIVTLWEPEAVVIQIGIVDCAPRLFSPLQHALLNNRWFHWRIARIIIRTASRFRRQIITIRPWVRYTPRKRFQKTLDRLEDRVKGIPHLLILPILKTFPEHEYRSPGYNRSVDRYNAMWRDWCERVGAFWISHETVQQNDSMERLLLTDGHHLSVEGHKRIAEILAVHFLEHFT